MSDTDGNAAQTRAIAEQLGDALLTKFTLQHPELRKPEIPPPLKWASGIIAALFVAAVAGMAVWLVTTVNEMQVTLARMDERMGNQTTTQLREVESLSRRVGALEAYNQRGGK